MAANIYGLYQVERAPGATLTENDAGTTVFTERIQGRKDEIEGFYFSLIRRTSTNIDYPSLSLESKAHVHGEGGIHFLDLVWAGLISGSGSAGTAPAEKPVWILKRSPSEEPIETHPDFAEFGTASNGAKFDEDGLFLGFSGDKPLRGIEKFLDGGAVVQKTSVYKQVPSALAKQQIPILEEPSGAPWDLPERPDIEEDSVEWMKTDLNIVQRGAAFEVTEEWTLGGQRGWNTTIYPS